jgi:hypothetical protein
MLTSPRPGHLARSKQLPTSNSGGRLSFDQNTRFEQARSSQRIGDQAVVLCALKRLSRPGQISPRRNTQIRKCRELGKLRSTAHAFERALDPALQESPFESGRTSDRTKRENEAVGDRGAQQSLRSPYTRRAIEFRRWRCLQRRQPL